MEVKLIHITQDAEQIIVHCARVSNPASQEKGENQERLIRYLVEHKHWSPFEMASMCVEIETTRAISAQILRHRSFSFQEFSQRYAETPEILMTPARSQDEKNRQNSVDDLDDTTKEWWKITQTSAFRSLQIIYHEALDRGIAKEVARMILPMASYTRLYMHGTIRSWIHYLGIRTGQDTQLEHRQIALEIQRMFDEHLPAISNALERKSSV